MNPRIVITLPYSLGTAGGGPMGCFQIARHLRAAGAEVTLLPVASDWFTKKISAEPSERQKVLIAESVKVIPVAPSRFHPLLDGISVRAAVKRLLSKERVDAVLGWATEVAFLPNLLRSRGVTFGMIAAASYYTNLKPRPIGYLVSRPRRLVKRMFRDDLFLRRPFRTADLVFAASDSTRRAVIEMGGIDPENVVVAYWGVEPEFALVRRSYTGEVSRLIFYGHFIDAKGIFEAIAALGRVAALGLKNWTFKIIGWGDEERVRRTAAENGIGDRIVLMGRMSHRELVRELEWAHMAILPSHAESFGLANAEAQASGLPVVAYQVGAVPEVVKRDVTGWLVPKGRVELLAEAVIEAMKDPWNAYRRGQHGRERIVQMFSWDRTAKTILHNTETSMAAKKFAYDESLAKPFHGVASKSGG